MKRNEISEYLDQLAKTSTVRPRLRNLIRAIQRKFPDVDTASARTIAKRYLERKRKAMKR